MMRTRRPPRRRSILPPRTLRAVLFVLACAGALQPAGAQVIRPSVAFTLHSQGSAAAAGGDNVRAADLFARAAAGFRAADDDRNEGVARRELGGALLRSGRLREALRELHAALELLRAPDDALQSARALATMGSAYDAVARPDSAIASYHAALVLFEAEESEREAAAVMASLGTAFQNLSVPDSAAHYYDKAVAVYRRRGETDAEIIVPSQMNDVGADPTAQLERALALLAFAERTGSRATRGAALQRIGLLYMDELDKPDSAFIHLSAALAIARATGDVDAELATIGPLGALQSRFGVDSAVSYFRGGLQAARRVRNAPAESYFLSGIGGVYSLSSQHLTRASSYFDSASSVQAAHGSRLDGELYRLAAREYQNAMTAEWTMTWLRLGNEGHRTETEAQLGALAAAERGRAQELLDLMRGRVVLPPGRDLVTEGASLAFPAAASGSSVLYYLMTADLLLMWFVAPDGVITMLASQITPARLASLVARLRAATAQAEDLEDCSSSEPAAAAELSSLLTEVARVLLPRGLRDRLAMVDDLVIIPHGLLNTVPFAALPLDAAGTPLGIRHAIRYAPSLSTLNAVERAAPTDPRALRLTDSLVLGDPAMPLIDACGISVRLNPLAQAGAASQRLAHQLGSPYLTGAGATAAAVHSRLSSAPIVHLATHGYAYSRASRARDTWLALADGPWTVGHILNDAAPLDAELVVLAACQSGLGDIREAEGTVGLQRAFLARGARSVLVSLWVVSEEATAALTASFYSHWLDDPDRPHKSEALRRAQVEVRGGPGSRWYHPRFWAAFQLVGAR